MLWPMLRVISAFNRTIVTWNILMTKILLMFIKQLLEISITQSCLYDIIDIYFI